MLLPAEQLYPRIMIEPGQFSLDESGVRDIRGDGAPDAQCEGAEGGALEFTGERRREEGDRG
jgi:hypothetical protein